MMLLCVMAAMTVPLFRNFSQGRVVGSCAARIVSLGEWARTQAVTRGTTFRLNLDPATNTYWLTVDRDGEFQTLGEEFGRSFAAPEGVTLQWYGNMPVDTAQFPSLDFLPTGRTSAAATILVSDSKGSSSEVACRSPGEPLRVLADWERTLVVQ